MSTPPLSPQEVSSLIDHLLKSKDPATVGLRRILRRKTEEGKGFPLAPLRFQDFGKASGKQGGIFDEQETQVLLLEKQLSELRRRMDDEKKRAEQAVRQAFAKGLEEGVEKGRREAGAEAGKRFEEQVSQIEERLAGFLVDVKKAREELLLGAQKAVVELSMAIARKVVNTELSLNPDTVLSVIKKALTFISEREHLVVRVAADDLETVTNKKEFWTSISERLEGIRIEADPRIRKGGCIIESSSGVADARLDVLLEELNDVIEETWKSLLTEKEAAGGQADVEQKEEPDQTSEPGKTDME